MKHSTKADVGGRMLPSERDVLRALDELGGKAGKTDIGKTMGVSSVYSEFVCRKFVGKGYIKNLGRGMYALTEVGTAWLKSHPKKTKKMPPKTKTRRKKRATTLDISTETEKVECAFCRGTGIDRFPVLSPKSNCVVCNGRGVVRVRMPYTTCQACGGTGVYTGSHLYC